MPIYEYLCTSCGFQFEEVQKFNDPLLEECPDCGKKRHVKARRGGLVLGELKISIISTF